MQCNWLVALCLFAVTSAGDVSGFADSVIYSFGSKAETMHFLTLLEPLATYVEDHETAITLTFRPFLSTDGSSVLVLERFVDQAAHDGPHSNSTVHLEFTAKVAAWNASTHAITNKIHSDLQETSLGAFDRNSSKSIAVSGFTDSVLYVFKDSSSRKQFMTYLAPLASYVRDNEEQITYTFRPFLSTDDDLGVFIFERFPNQAAHDGPHFNSSVHQAFSRKVSTWNASTQGITNKIHMDWQELSMGVLNRKVGQSLPASMIV